MPEFTFQNDRFSRLAIRSLLVLQLAALVLVVGLSLSGLFFLAVIISFLTFFVFIAVIVWLYVRYRELPVVRQKKELERLVLKFQKNLQAEAKTIQACKKERDQLFRAEKEEARATLRTLQREHIENGLAEALIKEARIPGMGPKIKERLAGYGILSAAHVNHKIDELPGFGEVKRQALLSWRSSVLAKLESTKPTTLSLKQLEIIKQNYQVLHDKNNAAERKAITSQQILEHELIALKPRLRQFTAITFLGYLSHSLASRGVVAALIALVLITMQVVSSVSATGSAILASIPTKTTSPTATPTLANTATPTYTPPSTITDTATITFSPTATYTPPVPATHEPTRTPLPGFTPVPLLPTLDPLQGVTAICNDGTYSYSQHSRGTCSHHGGVKQWIHKPPS
jgi:Protein of unknown function (DUF3761)